MLAASMTPSRRSILTLTLLLVPLQWNCSPISLVNSTRIRLSWQKEPSSAQVNNNYRATFRYDQLFDATQANVSFDDSNIFPKPASDQLDSEGNFLELTYRFSLSEQLEKSASFIWMICLQERNALHIYDNREDRKLAAGPQVNQELCRLHLDYMIHMNKKHNTKLENSTERTIAILMNAFDTPHLGLLRGSRLFLGDYVGCTQKTKLNIIKHELAEVDGPAAEEYFANIRREYMNRSAESYWDAFKRFVQHYVGPLVGFARDRDVKLPVEQYIDKMHPLPMRYCMAALRWPSWPNETFYKRNMVLRTAVCLPETCDSRSIDLYMDKIKWLHEYMIPDYYKGYYIDDLYCLPDTNSPMRDSMNFTSAKLFILFMTVWACLTIVATLMHTIEIRSKSQKGQRRKTIWDSVWWDLFRSWSLIKNSWDCLRLFKRPAAKQLDAECREGVEAHICKPAKNRGDIEPVEGIKAMLHFWIIWVHSYMLVLQTGWNSKSGDYIMTKSWISPGMPLAASSVDVFFVLTGVLTARFIFQLSPKLIKSPVFWLRFFVYRYTRIVPSYLLVHWFLRSYFRFLGDGPLWDYGTSHSSWSRVCQDDSNWSVIIPQANFKSPSYACNVVGWHLANDVQMSLLTPIFALLFLKSQKLGHTCSIAISLTATVVHVQYFMNNLKDVAGIFEWTMMYLTQLTDDVTPGYVEPWYRCTPYVIGFAAGHLLLRYECGHIKAWPRWLPSISKALAILTFYGTVSMIYLSSMMSFEDEFFTRLMASLIHGTIHLINGISCALFLLILCTNHVPWLSKFLKLSAFKPFANASLSIALIHTPWAFYMSGKLTRLPELSSYDIAVQICTWIVQSYFLGLIFFISFESPLRRIFLKLVIHALKGKTKSDKLRPNKVKQT